MNSQELRGVLLDQIEQVIGGKTTPEKAKAVAMLASVMLNSVAMEIKLHGYMKTTRDMKPLDVGTLRLTDGSEKRK